MRALLELREIDGIIGGKEGIYGVRGIEIG